SSGPLPEQDLALAQAMADVATIAILSERAISHGEVVAHQLQTALDSRVVIDQAKGVVAQHLTSSTDVAFEQLRGYSRRNNLRLGEVAGQVIAGEITADDLADSTSRSPT